MENGGYHEIAEKNFKSRISQQRLLLSIEFL